MTMTMVDGGDSMTDALDFLLNSFSVSSFAYQEREHFAAFCDDEEISSTTAINQIPNNNTTALQTASPTNSNQLKPKNKKKRKPAEISKESDCFMPARIPLPRIWKSDIRRQYGTMFANVFNNGDYSFMWNFLDTFVRPDDLYIMKKVGAPDPLVTIIGKPKLADYWFERMHDAPDLMFTIDHSKLKIRSDGTSVFSTRFAIKGVIVIGNEEQQKMYEAKINDSTPCTGEVEDLHNLHNTSSSSDKMSISETSSVFNNGGIDDDIVDALLDDPIQQIENAINNDQAVKTFEPKIIDYLVVGMITMHLDADCQLGMLEMIIDQGNSKKGMPWRPTTADSRESPFL